jgi:hypothetical protein
MVHCSQCSAAIQIYFGFPPGNLPSASICLRVMWTYYTHWQGVVTNPEQIQELIPYSVLESLEKY